MTGTWRAKLHADPKATPITQVVVPGRGLRPRTARPQARRRRRARSRPTRRSTIKVAGRYLYGPPAAGLAHRRRHRRQGRRPRTSRASPAIASARPTRAISPVRKPLEKLPRTDDDGKADVAVTLPRRPEDRPAARGRRHRAPARGRRPHHRAQDHAAGRPAASRASASSRCSRATRSAKARRRSFEAVLLDADGKRDRRPASTGSSCASTPRWQWYSRDGRGTTSPRPSRARSPTARSTPAAGAPAEIAADVDYGRYRLEVATADASGPSSSVDLQRRLVRRRARRPTARRCSTSRSTSRATSAGETAKLRIAVASRAARRSSPCSARACCPRRKSTSPRAAATWRSRSASDWGPGAYVDGDCSIGRWTRRRSACRAAPSACAGSASTRRRARSRSRSTRPKPRSSPAATLTVPVKIDGLAAGEEARVTVAAVDVGILNLTRYRGARAGGLVLRPAQLGTRNARSSTAA